MKNLGFLEECRLKSIERILIEKSRKLETKKDKTLLDYVSLLEIVKECRDVQDQIFALQRKRQEYSEQELEELVLMYKNYEDMPCRILFFQKND